MTRTYQCSDPADRTAGITAAIDAVRRGDLIVLPTDTVYGIGADAFNPAAVQRLLEAKGRGRNMPPPVLVPETRTIDGLASSIPFAVRELIDAFWPGALTIVCRAQPSLSWDLGDTNGTVTEVLTGLRPGQQVITGQLATDDQTAGAGASAGGGGGRRRQGGGGAGGQ